MGQSVYDKFSFEWMVISCLTHADSPSPVAPPTKIIRPKRTFFFQIPQCTWPISHNTPFRIEMCIFLFWMVYYGLCYMCILGFVRVVFSKFDDDCRWYVLTKYDAIIIAFHKSNPYNCLCVKMLLWSVWYYRKYKQTYFNQPKLCSWRCRLVIKGFKILYSPSYVVSFILSTHDVNFVLIGRPQIKSHNMKMYLIMSNKKAAD